jgi:hypothetical protein
LNIVARRQWARPYLGCYLRLVEDDWCSIPENGPLQCHFTTWEEELFEICTVSFNFLAALLHQGVKGRLEDVVFIEVGFIGAKVSTLHVSCA